ncbi:MAG: hypothetical protein LUH51_03760 [Firmicutes bacterium]|nr:hypothetical protein [Bacillota bacterium]
MKHINSWIGKTLAFVLCVSMLAGVAAAASAASNSEIDFSQTGSITLSLETGDGSLVSGGTVTLYAVATLYLDDGDMAYAYTEAFSGCEATLDASDTSLPAALAAYAAAGALAGTSAQVSDLGTVCFEDLALGLYLLVQTEA